MSKRDATIDMCKGLGMLFVVLGHLPFLFGSIIYSFHMGFFFILSGWCFSNKHLQNGIGYIYSRFVRLFVPFLIMKGFSFAFQFIEGGNEVFEKYHLIGTAWFLSALFGVSIVSWFVIKLSLKFNICLFCPPLLFLGLAFMFDTLSFFNLPILFRLSTWCYFSFYFLFGYYLKNTCPHILLYKQLDTKKYILLTGGILALLLAKRFIPVTIDSCTSISFVPYSITTIIGSYITLSFVLYLKEKNILTNFLSLVGRNNMSILLFQWPCISLIEYLTFEGHVCLSNPTLVFIAKFVSAISIPVFFSYLYGILKDRVLKNTL